MGFNEIVLAALLTLPTHDGIVTDNAHKLEPQQIAALTQVLTDYRDRTTNAIVILTVPSMDGVTIEEYANKVFHAWGIGDAAKDNGVLLVWSVEERKVRIEVGYGLEPSLPDGRAGQIIRDVIVPAFKRQQWYDGLNAGVQAIITQLDVVATGFAPAETPTRSFPWLPLFFGVGGLALVGGLGLVWSRRRRKKEEVVEWPDFSPLQRPSYLTNKTLTTPRRRVMPAVVVVPVEHESYSRSPSSSYSSGSSYSSFDSSSSSSSSSSSDSSSSSFGGGDSGGGGASGSY